MLTETFKQRTQAAWLDGVRRAPTPASARWWRYADAPDHPHLRSRGTFVERDGVVQPAPAPRFSRTEATISASPDGPGARTREALTAWGLDPSALLASGAVTQAG